MDADGDGVIDDDEIEVERDGLRPRRGRRLTSTGTRAALMDWVVIAIAAAGALVLGGSYAGARLPEIHPGRAAGVPGRERPARTGSTGRSGRRCSSATWPSAPRPASWWRLVLGDWRLAVGRRAGHGAQAGRRAAGAAPHGRPPRRPPAPGHQRAGRHPAGRRRAERAGPSFPSGHVILVAADRQRRRQRHPGGAGRGCPHLLVVLVMLGRVYVGAHNPLDVTAGLGTGLLVGSVLDLLLARDRRGLARPTRRQRPRWPHV